MSGSCQIYRFVVLNVLFHFILNESLSLTKVFSSFFHLAVLNVEVFVLKLKEMNKCNIARGDIILIRIFAAIFVVYLLLCFEIFGGCY